MKGQSQAFDSQKPGRNRKTHAPFKPVILPFLEHSNSGGIDVSFALREAHVHFKGYSPSLKDTSTTRPSTGCGFLKLLLSDTVTESWASEENRVVTRDRYWDGVKEQKRVKHRTLTVCLIWRSIPLWTRFTEHLLARHCHRIPEDCPQDAGIAGRSRQRAVVAIILI